MAAGADVFGLARLVDNAYFYFAGYVVLQYIVLATAWNILGGYTGYVNFGIPASSLWAPTARSCCTKPPTCRRSR